MSDLSKFLDEFGPDLSGKPEVQKKAKSLISTTDASLSKNLETLTEAGPTVEAPQKGPETAIKTKREVIEPEARKAGRPPKVDPEPVPSNNVTSADWLKLPPVRERKTFRVGLFRKQEEAESFISSFPGTVYYVEGLAHAAALEIEDGVESPFIDNARKAGAFQCFIHSKIV